MGAARNRILLLLACGLATVPLAAGSEVVDDFNDGILDPSIWQQHGWAPGRYAREMNGRLEVYNDGTDNGITGVRTKLPLPAEGYFRVQVSFNASECADESALSLSIHNANADHTVQHVFIANGVTDEREWAVGWSAPMNDETGTFQHELTSAASGVFYITYEAGIIHLSHTGYGMENAMRTVDTRNWTDCTEVFVGLEVWADGHRLSGAGAYFDDFRLDMAEYSADDLERCDLADDFNDAVIDASTWVLPGEYEEGGEPSTRYPVETNGHLQIYNDGTENDSVEVRTRALLPADGYFRVQVSFDASECAEESGVFLAVHNAATDSTHAVQYALIANAVMDGRRWIVFRSAGADDEDGSIETSQPTATTSGILYVTYNAGTIHLSHTCYGPEKALCTVETDDWTNCTRVFVALGAFSNGCRLSGAGAYFDDFCLNTTYYGGFCLNTTDLSGTWWMHGLISGHGLSQKPGWYWLSTEMDSAGNAWALDAVHDSLGNSSYVPVLGQFRVDEQGIVTNSHVDSYKGTMTPDADLIVGVGSMTPGSKSGVNGYSLQFLGRQGARFTTSDLAGTWWMHSLTSGEGAAWRGWSRFQCQIDDSGDFSAVPGSYLNSRGESDGPAGQLSITSDGILGFLSRPEAHGILNATKDFAVLTMNDLSGGYDLSILQKRSGVTFSSNDLAGVWYMHLLDAGYPSGSEGYEWCAWGILTMDASGAFTGSVTLTGLASATDGPAEKQMRVNRSARIRSDGIITFADDPSAHGTMSDDKNVIVVTENGGDGEYNLAVLVRGGHVEPPDEPKPESAVEDFETGDFSKFGWRHEGDSPWLIVFNDKHSGLCSARAGQIEDDQTSVLKMTRSCQAGEIGFYVKTSSESSYDELVFAIDGQSFGEWSGYTDWKQVSYPVSAGSHTFTWSYVKDSSASEGADTAWLDDVSFP